MSAARTQPTSLDPKDVASSAGDALDALARAGAQGEALVDAWLKGGNVAAIARASEQAAGPARKAARRALNVLKSRGVAVPTESRVVNVVGAKSPEIEEALLLAPDASGSICLVLTAREKTSRARSAFVFLHDEVGIHRVNVGELSQSQLKDAIQRALPGVDYKPVKVPLAWARARIAAARQKHRAHGMPEPLGFSSAAALLEPVPASAPEHPFDAEGLELSDDDAPDLAKTSGALHGLPEFRGWFPAKAAVDELLLKLGETLTPGVEPPADEMKQKLEEQIVAATDRYFTPERREQLVRAMKDSALSVLHREGESRALEVVATMKVVQNAGLITNPPHEIGFLRAYFDKAVSALAYRDGGRLRIPVPNKPAEPTP